MSATVPPVLVTVLGSSRVDGMYLYVPRGADYDDLPEPLRLRFGVPREVMTLPLVPTKPLARADAAAVLAAIAEHGFYLQMPPQAGEDPLDDLVARQEGHRQDGQGGN